MSSPSVMEALTCLRHLTIRYLEVNDLPSTMFAGVVLVVGVETLDVDVNEAVDRNKIADVGCHRAGGWWYRRQTSGAKGDERIGTS